MEFTDVFNNAWTYIIGAAGSIGLGTFIGLITAVINLARVKKENRENYERMTTLIGDTTKQAVDRVENVTFTHTIKPLVESELQKVYEYSIKVLETALSTVQGQYVQVISILDSLAKYFDNSIGVPDEVKEELKAKLEEAKNAVAVNEPVESHVTVAQVVENDKKAQNSASNDVNMSR